MAKQAVLKVSEGKTEEAITGFLRSLLEKGVVEAVLIPKMLPSGDGIVQTLIHDPEKLKGVSVLSPTMPVQSARVTSSLTGKNLGKKVAALLKACEIRAVVELTKFLQVKLDNLYLIGVDCPGTFEVPDFAKMAQEGKGGENLVKELLTGMEKGDVLPPQGYTFRTACQMCEYPVPQADVVLKLFGYKTDQEIGVEIGEKLEKEIEEKGILSLIGEKDPTIRTEVVNKVIAGRTKKRDGTFKEFKGVVKDLRSFLDRFSTCIRCHNCMVACPICYCKECVFRTAVFEHEGDQFIRWADRKGGIRMPTDTLMFHLIRMSHMVTSCIGCGLCDSACPSRLPVASLFRSVGDKIQKMVQYVPGRDVKEAPPVATFKEDELKIESGAL
ncbi:MAG TPA: 4Fe-4S dicluster domain-containing protein [Thermodesulfobacteriota bacterium]|nr:4Fe-4S dicluster domain-containing protein [Thermodesulfobacteriota bacterium]